MIKSIQCFSIIPILFGFFMLTSCKSNDEIKEVEDNETSQKQEMDYRNFHFRNNAKYKILNQPIFSNNQNKKDGVWLQGAMMKINYFHQDTTITPSSATLDTYTFSKDSLFYRRTASFKTIYSCSGSYSTQDNMIITKNKKKEDENSSQVLIGGTKKWSYNFLDDDRLILQEEKHGNTAFSFLYHRLKTQNTNNYKLDDLRNLLIKNTFFVTGINNEDSEKKYSPSIQFLNDSTHIIMSFDSPNWTPNDSNLESSKVSKYLRKGVYLLDDFSIKGEIFLRVSHLPSIQITDIKGDTIIGIIHGMTTDTVKLVKRNLYRTENDFQGVWNLEKPIEFRRGFKDCLKMGESIDFKNGTMKINFLDGKQLSYSYSFLSNSLLSITAKNEDYKNHDFWDKSMLIFKSLDTQDRMAIRIVRDNFHPDVASSFMYLTK